MESRPIREESVSSKSLLEVYGDKPCTITYNGIATTLTLKEWFLFCPSDTPFEQMDPQKVEQACNDILEGRIPSFDN